MVIPSTCLLLLRLYLVGDISTTPMNYFIIYDDLSKKLAPSTASGHRNPTRKAKSSSLNTSAIVKDLPCVHPKENAEELPSILNATHSSMLGDKDRVFTLRNSGWCIIMNYLEMNHPGGLFEIGGSLLRNSSKLDHSWSVAIVLSTCDFTFAANSTNTSQTRTWRICVLDIYLDATTLVSCIFLSNHTHLAFILEMEQEFNTSGRARCLRDDTNHVTHFIYSTSDMLSLYHRFPDLLLIDSTYSTNQQKYILFQLLVVDGSRRSLPVALGFLWRETEADVSTFLQTFFEFVGGSLDVKCIFSDGAPAIANAINNVIPFAVHLLCRVHIIRNVIKRFPQSESFRLFFIAMHTMNFWRYLASLEHIRINDPSFFHI